MTRAVESDTSLKNSKSKTENQNVLESNGGKGNCEADEDSRVRDSSANYHDCRDTSMMSDNLNAGGETSNRQQQQQQLQAAHDASLMR